MTSSNAIEIGSIIVLDPEQTEQYPPEWQGRRMRVTTVARNREEHPGYDASTGGPLVDCEFEDTGEPVSSSFYPWEFRTVDAPGTGRA